MATKYFTNGYETSKDNYTKALALAFDNEMKGLGFDQDQRIIDGVLCLYINNVPQLF